MRASGLPAARWVGERFGRERSTDEAILQSFVQEVSYIRTPYTTPRSYGTANFPIAFALSSSPMCV
ncbi:hypothetical protein LCGC14_1436920 [marine sediment metagenome]|uniref:Uncharacterized protein n=1 Tax=marine sediment metagenome TaxID=412755 RepID=A0A0F9JMG4_9ZZZZ